MEFSSLIIYGSSKIFRAGWVQGQSFQNAAAQCQYIGNSESYLLMHVWSSYHIGAATEQIKVCASVIYKHARSHNIQTHTDREGALFLYKVRDE